MEKGGTVIIVEDNDFVRDATIACVKVIGKEIGENINVISCSSLQELKDANVGEGEQIKLAVIDGSFPEERGGDIESGMGELAIEHLLKTTGISIEKIIVHSGDPDFVLSVRKRGITGILKSGKIVEAIESVLKKKEG